MSERAAPQTIDLADHPALAAWRRLAPGHAAPHGIEVLKEKGKTAVYRLLGAGPDGSNVVAKCTYRDSVAIELTVYAEVLPRLPVSNLTCYGMADDVDGRFAWLFLEDAGDQWYAAGEAGQRAAAGRYLGLLHTHVPVEAFKGRLPERGRAHYLDRLRFSRDMILRNISNPSLAPDHVGALRSILSQCDHLESRWPEVDEFCAQLPEVIVHGDFVKKNLRVRNGGGEFVVLPLDWETAGWGTPAADLLRVDMDAYWSLAAGRWPPMTTADRQRLADIGMLFRLIAAVSWEVRTLRSDWVRRAMRNLMLYDTRLAAASASLGWPVPPLDLTARPDEELKGLLAHPAVAAWREAGQTSLPAWIETVKGDHRKSAVYRLVRAGPDGGNVIAKRCRRSSAEVERRVYQQVLPRLPAPSPAFYGAADDPEVGWLWLLMEDAGDEAYSPGNEEHRRLGAQWLAGAHAAAAGLREGPALPDRGPTHYRSVLSSARDTLREALANPAFGPDGRAVLADVISRCDKMESRWNEVVAACAVIPCTLVHGGFGRKNVRVCRRSDGPALIPFDWEAAGWGTPAADLSRVDIATYFSIVREAWSRLEAPQLERLAVIGKMFRALSAIPGETRSLASAWPERIVKKMRVYLTLLDEAFTEIGWR